MKRKITYFALLLGLFIAKAQTIVTVAGNPETGSAMDNLPATSSAFKFPTDIFIDSTGNFYISTFHRIKKVNASTGIMNNIAGGGGIGFTGDGEVATGVGVRFSGPQGVVVDSQGNVYISDTMNHRIRKVSKSTGIISTIAGNGAAITTPIGDGLPAISARLYQPSGIYIDASDNIYFADSAHHRIRRIDHATGIITTVAGTGFYSWTSGNNDLGLATNVNLYYPVDVTMDNEGNLFIANSGGHNVLKVNANTQMITKVAGAFDTASFSGDGGPAKDAGLNAPGGVAVDNAGNVYISDSHNHRIRKVDAASGIITTIAGTGTPGFSGDGGNPLSANLNTPEDLFITNTGALYFTDRENDRVRKIYNADVLNTKELNHSFITDIYPNPVSDKVNFTAQQEGVGQLYSAIGSLVRNITIKKGVNIIDISSLGKGVYFVTMDGKSYKIIKN